MPFSCPEVDTGQYLWRCLRYVELNMVRCGAVGHPREWEWLGYHEIMGTRHRYRLLDLERLCWRFGTASIEDVRRNPEATLQEAIVRNELRREPCWTDSLAVGSRSFLDQVQPLILSRREAEIVEDNEPGLWMLKETEIPYGTELGLKTSSRARE